MKSSPQALLVLFVVALVATVLVRCASPDSSIFDYDVVVKDTDGFSCEVVAEIGVENVLRCEDLTADITCWIYTQNGALWCNGGCE